MLYVDVSKSWTIMNEIINETILDLVKNPSINGYRSDICSLKPLLAINLNSKKKKKQPRVFVTHPENYIHPKGGKILRGERKKEREKERKEFAFILIYANNMAYISRILSYFYGDARLSGRARARRGV